MSKELDKIIFHGKFIVHEEYDCERAKVVNVSLFMLNDARKYSPTYAHN